MDELKSLYERIDFLRERGVKMKEIADWIDLSPSVLSSLYTTVLPAFLESVKQETVDMALNNALAMVNNISRKRLLGNLTDMLNRLNELQPDETDHDSEINFMHRLCKDSVRSVEAFPDVAGTYISYSLSSSSDSLKVEPFMISVSESKQYIQTGRLNAYGEIQWGTGIIGTHQNLYCLFSEHTEPQLTLVTIYIQLPMFRNPHQLRGIYIGLDYNHNPVARRILFVREGDVKSPDEFLLMDSGIIPANKLEGDLLAYYEYTCQPGDYIKMCTIPSLKMDTTDLIREKKMLEI